MTAMNLIPDSGFLAMPDSVRVGDLPGGYDAYLGYADGDYPTAAELTRRFPAAHKVILTVTGQMLNCDGCDCEPGNLNAADMRMWVQRKLQLMPAVRPVVYASVKGKPNFGMGDVLAALSRNGIGRSRVRLLSAHYGQGPHICGPATCGEIGVPMDGTQWTDEYRVTVDGTTRIIDMSVLLPGFFGSGETETERLVRELGIVRQGDHGEIVKTVQRLCNGRSGPVLAVDGVFGFRTTGAVEIIQVDAGITQDGIVGPQTWPVLLGVA